VPLPAGAGHRLTSPIVAGVGASGLRDNSCYPGAAGMVEDCNCLTGRLDVGKVRNHACFWVLAREMKCAQPLGFGRIYLRAESVFACQGNHPPITGCPGCLTSLRGSLGSPRWALVATARAQISGDPRWRSSVLFALSLWVKPPRTAHRRLSTVHPGPVDGDL